MDQLAVQNITLVKTPENACSPKIGLEFVIAETKFHVPGEIVWAHRLGENFECGVHFLDVHEATQDAIMKFVFVQKLADRK